MDTSRYSCQIALPGFGPEGQKLLKNARVLLVGLGGLGCPAAQYLTAAGIGTIGLADDDTVSIGNLHRQILYNPDDAGKLKVLVAAEKLSRQNPDINIITHPYKITSQNALELFQGYDVILDGTDNFEARYLLNDAAVLTDKPLVYGAIYQYEGQVAIFNFKSPDGSRSANYRDLFPEIDASQVPGCTEGGVLPTLAGIIGCMMSAETLKLLTHIGEPLVSKLLIYDTLSGQSKIIKTAAVSKTNIVRLPPAVDDNTISTAELRKSLQTKEIKLVDIRSSQEHDDFNIGGVNIPAYKLERSIENTDRQKPIVLYCGIGLRSGEVVKKLKQLYPDIDIRSLAGGIKAWQNAVNPD